MTTSATPPGPESPKGAPKSLAAGENPIDPGLDERLHAFWRRNRQAVLVFCVLVFIGYLGKAGWEYFQNQKEVDVLQEFAAASTPDRLKGFAEAHPEHPLAGIAQLRIADAAYAAGGIDTAAAAYARAVELLKTGPLAARAQLGLAMAKIQSGQTAAGEAALNQLAQDARQYKAIRTEATYQLASLAAATGRASDVQKYSVQLMQIDPNSPWTQRAYELAATAAAPRPAPASPAPGISFKPGAKK